MYELPNRLDGDTRDEKDNLTLNMFLFFFKYKLKFNIYFFGLTEEKVKESISKLKVTYQLGNKR